MPGASWGSLQDEVRGVAESWRADGPSRRARRALDLADFERLAQAGFLLVAVPEEDGGLWSGVPGTTRKVCEVLRTLAGGDPSVALVSAMHPAVLGYWLVPPDPGTSAWTEQRGAVIASAVQGARWGTITSEPGSGGDILRTKTQALSAPERTSSLPGPTYLLTGDKHFGSGSGVTSFMITTAVAPGDDGPSLFAIDVRDRPWDGSAGLELIAEWDGVGMSATQSHGMRLESCPAVRVAWDGPVEEVTLAAAPFITCLFTAVVLGVLDEAVRTARTQLQPKAETMRAYEQVEWSRAEAEHWLAVQAYEGALRAVETGDAAASLHSALRAKVSVAELAESCLARLARVVGGGTYSARSPFASWYEDVRALGFLRPPWGLAYDSLFRTSFASGDESG